jgi:hypothetical protein
MPSASSWRMAAALLRGGDAARPGQVRTAHLGRAAHEAAPASWCEPSVVTA